MIVVDTDVLIDALRGRQPAAGRVAEGLEAGALATTAVTVFELLSGAKGRRQMESIGALLGALPVLPFDAAAGEEAASLRRKLEGRGEGIGMADYLIAGVCVTRSAALLTGNRKHFQRIDALTLADLQGQD